jgi:hypothetical protein
MAPIEQYPAVSESPKHRMRSLLGLGCLGKAAVVIFAVKDGACTAVYGVVCIGVRNECRSVSLSLECEMGPAVR